MKRLIRLEFNKLRGYRAFWILFILYFAGLALTVGAFNGILNSFISEQAGSLTRVGWTSWNLNAFPDSWHYLTYLGGLFHYILMVIIIILICNEFNYKTVRQNIIDGMSRGEWLLGKFLSMVTIALMSTLLVFFIIVILGFLAPAIPGDDEVFGKFIYIPAYFIQLLGYLSFAFLLGMLIRRTGIAIGLTFIYALPLENVLEYYLPESIEGFLPLESMNRMISFPFDFDLTMPEFEPQYMLISVVWIGILIGSAYLYLKRRDL
ncbi:MAG: ABC transporter permease subunit [Bacteroidota bacterium]